MCACVCVLIKKSCIKIGHISKKMKRIWCIWLTLRQAAELNGKQMCRIAFEYCEIVLPKHEKCCACGILCTVLCCALQYTVINLIHHLICWYSFRTRAYAYIWKSTYKHTHAQFLIWKHNHVKQKRAQPENFGKWNKYDEIHNRWCVSS